MPTKILNLFDYLVSMLRQIWFFANHTSRYVSMVSISRHDKKMCNHTSRHAWKMCYFNIKIRRQFFMASMELCMVRRMVAHFGQPGATVQRRCGLWGNLSLRFSDHPSRDFSHNLKQNLSGLSVFYS